MWYVYLLSDPNTNEIFYVGKGKGNRVFDHFKNLKKDDPKSQKIKEILNQEKEPKIEFLIHGIENENTIKRIESSIIDLIDKKNLTNKIKGYESSDFGRMDLNQIIGKYSSKKVDIKEKVLLIKLSKSFRYNMSEVELYDYTRGIWIISEEKRNEIEYVFCVYDGIVQETYGIEITFSKWLIFGLPISLILLFISWNYLTQFTFSLKQKSLPGGRIENERQINIKNKILIGLLMTSNFF